MIRGCCLLFCCNNDGVKLCLKGFFSKGNLLVYGEVGYLEVVGEESITLSLSPNIISLGDRKSVV